ncbi:hypothetical protein [Prevotella sp.]|uniref:hypothetical protein n=1 Tax=Prevotella sp. TaxID=59823 RepID=UPI0025DC6F4E|nr:hypothetical protein [Prevotella sp.]
MKAIKSIMLASAMLLATPAFFSSCRENAPEIDYEMKVTVVNDFAKVVDAINSGALKNEQAILQLVAAIDKMNVNQHTKLQAIMDVIVSLNNTLDAKLATIEAALKAQTITMENKLALIEQVIKSQGTTLETKLGAIEAALREQTIAMEAKMDIIKNVLADQNATLETKLGAIEAAMKEQTIALSDKLTLIEQVIKDQTSSFNTKMDILAQAIQSLPDYTEKLEAVKTAFENINPNSQLETLNALLDKYGQNFTDKLASISGWFMEIGYGNGRLDMIKRAIESLGGYGGKLDAINEQMTALLQALESGNMSEKDAMAEIAKKLKELELNSGVGTAKETMEYVDLGLPSKIKWAKCDLGASSPEIYGDEYSWGETWTKTSYEYYYFTDIVEGQYTKYDSRDKRFFLEKEDDAAYLRLGEGWRTPTWNEMQELIDNCTVTESTLNGRLGMMFVSKINNNYIFFRCYSIFGKVCGNRWTSAIVESNPALAKSLYFEKNDKTNKIDVRRDDCNRKTRLPIRPVYVKRAAIEK